MSKRNPDKKLRAKHRKRKMAKLVKSLGWDEQPKVTCQWTPFSEGPCGLRARYIHKLDIPPAALCPKHYRMFGREKKFYYHA